MGYGWLKTVVENKEILFIPFTNFGPYVEAQVFLCNDLTKNKLDIGESLVSIGFAETKTYSQNQSQYVQSYLNQLKKKERVAKIFDKGQWSLIPEQYGWLKRRFIGVMVKLVPLNMKVPVIVRNV